MELKFKILGGRSAGQEVAVTGPQFLIGRADECQLRPKSDSVSRRHALVENEDSKALIRDLGSRTGTFVNGHLIPPKRAVELANGDTIKIGPLEFGVVIKFGLGGQKKPKVESVNEVAERTAAATGGEVDVTQWLQSTDEEVNLGETIDGSTTGSVVSAADLMGPTPEAPISAADAKKAETAPDQAASDMLKNYLRRR
jgi:pSer/pThr/pTyr-binding forkhead associated (FHA) protein